MSTENKMKISHQDIALKSLFTGYLMVVAIGYLMAILQIHFTHGLADGEVGLSVDDIVYSYYGKRSGSVIEAKLKGSMKNTTSEENRLKIINWIHKGADEKDFFDTGIRQIMNESCIQCHSTASSMNIPDFTQFKNIAKRAKTDTGASFASLARVSHIHLFGIAFIFMFVGMIFSLTTSVPKHLKATVIVMPYVFLTVDIASWWLTKLNPGFAWLTIIGGGAMAISFCFMWVVSIYEMWFSSYRYRKNQGTLLNVGLNPASSLIYIFKANSRKIKYLMWLKRLRLSVKNL